MAHKYSGWEGFEEGTWTKEIHIRSFIRHNYEPYDGNEDFLEAPTEITKKLWEQVCDLFRQEREAGGVLDMDTDIISTITSHAPGYIDKDREKIVGLQTDKPLKRAFMPYGGIRTAERACTDHGYEIDPKLKEFFTVHRKTHNAGVFDVYTPEMRACRSSHIITGLPDAYGRGRIIGDYRRVALYGLDHIIEEKQKDKAALADGIFDGDRIRLQGRGCTKSLKKLFLEEKDIIHTADGGVLYDGEIVRAIKLFQKVSGIYDDGIVGV